MRLRRCLVSLLCMLVMLLSSSFVAQKQTIVIQNESAGGVSPTFYGLNLEDVNRAVDGALNAELILNSSFAYRSENQDAAGMNGWNFNYQNRGGGSVELGTESPLSEANNTYARVVVSKAPYIIANNGHSTSNSGGMSLRQDEVYQLNISLRSLGFIGILRVYLVNESSTAVTQAVEIHVAPGEWRAYTETLSPSQETCAGRLFIELEGTGKLDIDLVSLLPSTLHGANSGQWLGGRLRTDTVELLQSLSPGYLSYPVNRTDILLDDATEYSWRDTIGPLSERRETYNPQGYSASQAIGLHEFFQLCEDLGAQAIPVISAGMFYGEDCASFDTRYRDFQRYMLDILNMLRYLTASEDGEWGAMRAENGHPEPFTVTAIMVGAGNSGQGYADAMRAITDYIKPYFPGITVIHCAEPSFNTAGAETWTSYLSSGKGNMTAAQYTGAPDWIFTNAGILDSIRSGGMKLSLTYAATVGGKSGVGRSTVEAALAEATLLCAAERNAGYISMMAYDTLLSRQGLGSVDPCLLWLDSVSAVRTPSYYVAQMYGSNIGTQVLRSESQIEGVYYSVTSNPEEGFVYVKLVNPGDKGLSITLQMEGFADIKNVVSLQSLEGRHLTDANNFTSSDADKIRPVTSAVTLDVKSHSNAQMDCSLAPYSVNVYKIAYLNAALDMEGVVADSGNQSALSFMELVLMTSVLGYGLLAIVAQIIIKRIKYV